MPPLYDHMVAQHPFAGGADTLQGTLRAQVAGIGLELHPDAAHPVEGVGQQQQLGLGVDAGALPLLAEPGPAYLECAMLGPYVQIAGTAHHPALGFLHDRDGYLGRVLQRLLDPLAHIRHVDKTGAGHEGPVGGHAAPVVKALGMLHGKRFQADPLSLQHDPLPVRGRHAAAEYETRAVVQGRMTVEPVVFLPSRSRWAWPTSASG